MSAIGDWLFWEFGASGVGSHYGVLSGAGSDISEVAIIGALYAGLRRINCPVTGCWRLGLHHTATGKRVCRRHHPEDELTVEQLHAEHFAAKRAALVAHYFSLRHEAQQQAGHSDYPPGHDAEQAMGPLFPAPPRAGDPIYGDSGAALRPEGRPAGHVRGRHRGNGTRSARGAPEASSGSEDPAGPDEDQRDPGWPQDGPKEAPQ